MPSAFNHFPDNQLAGVAVGWKEVVEIVRRYAPVWYAPASSLVGLKSYGTVDFVASVYEALHGLRTS